MKYRVDIFINDEFFGVMHMSEYFNTLTECYMFVHGWQNANSIFILENIIDNKYDVIMQVR